MTASRLPQSRRLRRLFRHKASTVFLPPHDCRSRGDCGFKHLCRGQRLETPPHDCRSRGDCGDWITQNYAKVDKPPHDCRSRGDCGDEFVKESTVLRFPPHDCRSRGDCGLGLHPKTAGVNDRLTIAAVAATAATSPTANRDLPPPRLTIAAVAATAAVRLPLGVTLKKPASRLPQSRRLRLAIIVKLAAAAGPPHDCRSRGDCGFRSTAKSRKTRNRLTIAAVAATAATVG